MDDYSNQPIVLQQGQEDLKQHIKACTSTEFYALAAAAFGKSEIGANNSLPVFIRQAGLLLEF